MKTFKAISLAVLLQILLVGCSGTTEPYPGSWAPIKNMSADCSEVAGTYQFMGDTAYEHSIYAGRTPQSLFFSAEQYDELTHNNNAERPLIRVDVKKIDGDRILVSAKTNEKSLVTTVLSIRCEKSGIRVQLPKREPTIQIGEDGSLVNHQIIRSCLFPFICGSEESWNRWQKQS